MGMPLLGSMRAPRAGGGGLPPPAHEATMSVACGRGQARRPLQVGEIEESERVWGVEETNARHAEVGAVDQPQASASTLAARPASTGRRKSTDGISQHANSNKQNAANFAAGAFSIRRGLGRARMRMQAPLDAQNV